MLSRNSQPPNCLLLQEKEPHPFNLEDWRLQRWRFLRQHSKRFHPLPPHCLQFLQRFRVLSFHPQRHLWLVHKLRRLGQVELLFQLLNCLLSLAGAKESAPLLLLLVQEVWQTPYLL